MFRLLVPGVSEVRKIKNRTEREKIKLTTEVKTENIRTTICVFLRTGDSVTTIKYFCRRRCFLFREESFQRMTELNTVQ